MGNVHNRLDLVGVVLVGGRGERARPVTLKAPGHVRSKAAVSFCGKRLIRWLLEAMKAQGMSRFLVVAKGRENRYQTRTLAGFGENLGLQLRYTPVRFDALNTGSADATLRELDHWDIDGPVLVFPTDSLYEFSASEMLAVHASRSALVTVASMPRTPAEVVGKYGVMRSAGDGRLQGFIEKPTLPQLRSAFPVSRGEDVEQSPLSTNAGMYLLDARGVRKYAHDDDLMEFRHEGLDFGKDYLPRVVERGLPVYEHPVSRVGDLGTVVDYIDTMVAVLRGEFGSLAPLMGRPLDALRHVWIPPETLQLADQATGKTLEEKLEEGTVVLGGNGRMGRYVEVAAGTRIVDSNIDDDVVIGPGAEIRRSALRDGVAIGPAATIDRSYIGTMARVESNPAHPTVIEDYVALGDEVVIQEGAHLAGRARVYPRVKIPAGAVIGDGVEVRRSPDAGTYL